MLKKFLALQTLILAGGVVFSWSRVVIQLQTFYARYGTFFKFNDCAIPNPLVTACFYGAVAFVVALVWSGLILQSEVFVLKNERYLRNFLLFGVCFAATVLTYEFLAFYKIIKTSGKIISCTPGVFPLYTPCFVGFLFFVGAFLVAGYIVKSQKISLAK